MSGFMVNGSSIEPSLKAAADGLRDKKAVPWARAKLEMPGGEGEHVEYFRGKDLVRYLQEHPTKCDSVLKDKSGRTPEEAAAELVRLFIARNVVFRTERKFKRPKPGRTRLVKWPRTLVPVKEQQWDAASFYVWRYDRPTSIWHYAAIAALPVVVIAACLFPLAPWWLRMALVYSLLGLLMTLMGVIGVRYLIFAFVWVLSGHSLWLFPNMMSDQVGLSEAFWPIITFTKAKSLAEGWKLRLTTAAVLGSLLWVLASHTPDMEHLKTEAKSAHDSLFNYIETMYSRNKTFLEGATGGGAAGAAGGAGFKAGAGGPGGPGAGARGGPGSAGGRPGAR